MIRNADEFRLAFSKTQVEYEQIFRPQLRKLNEALSSGVLPNTPQIDESREVHAREYIVNSLLAALNWRMTCGPTDGLPNLVPETAIAAEGTGTRRFMDYLGIEAGKTHPLLLVETKRPRAALPLLASTPPGATSYEENIARGLRGETLTGDWNKWLSKDVGDYVRSVQVKAASVLKRVVITNGDWLILFLDPADSFLGQGLIASGSILVCSDRADVLRQGHTLFEQLEHSRVLGGVRPLRPIELPFYVDSQFVDTAMHGLHLLYDEEPGIHAPPAPRIKVAPIIFLRSQFGPWFVAEGTIDYDLPRDPADLPQHLSDMRVAAEALLAAVNQALGTTLVPRKVEDHYSDRTAFSMVPGVTLKPGTTNSFRLVTGSTTHYLKPTISVPNCPFHDHAHAANQGCASGDIVVLRRSTKPRAFFYSKEENHCAHGDVQLAKSAAISASNEARCGSRSRRGGAFCEIWPFETHLCCRTCTYESVCTAAEVFNLPCAPG